MLPRRMLPLDAAPTRHRYKIHCAGAVGRDARQKKRDRKMALDNLIFAQCILYFLSFVFGFIAVVPLSENTEDFRGKCLLFTRGIWQNENITVSKQRFIVEEWGPESSCSFITFVGIASLILSAVQAWRLLFFLCKGHDEWVMVHLWAGSRWNAWSGTSWPLYRIASIALANLSYNVNSIGRSIINMSHALVRRILKFQMYDDDLDQTPICHIRIVHLPKDTHAWYIETPAIL